MDWPAYGVLGCAAYARTLGESNPLRLRPSGLGVREDLVLFVVGPSLFGFLMTVGVVGVEVAWRADFGDVAGDVVVRTGTLANPTTPSRMNSRLRK